MNLEELLAADASAPTLSKEKLALFDPSLWPLLQVALETFQMFDDCMKRAFDKTVSEGSEYLRQQARALGITDEELNRMVSVGECETLHACLARSAYIRIQASFARAIIFWLLNRWFLWGMTDLLRMRVIAADGYCRLQAESIGLLLTISADHNVGARWLYTKTHEEEKSFYTDMQKQLKEMMRRVALH